MGNYDARIPELKEPLARMKGRMTDAELRNIGTILDTWIARREELLNNLAHRAEFDWLQKDQLAVRWREAILRAQDVLQSLFEDSLPEVAKNAELKAWWWNTMGAEQYFLAGLADLPTPDLVEQLNRHAVEVQVLTSELAEKWRSTQALTAGPMTDETSAVQECIRLSKEILDEMEDAQSAFLSTLGRVADAAAEGVRKIDELVSEQNADGAIDKLVGLIGGLFGVEVGEQTGQAMAQSTRHTLNWMSSWNAYNDAYLTLIGRYRNSLVVEGGVLSMFATNRQLVEDYRREARLQTAEGWKAQSAASLETWVRGLRSEGQRKDGATFQKAMSKILDDILARTTTMHQSFIGEFRGLFEGTLSGVHFETLTRLVAFEKYFGELHGVDLVGRIEKTGTDWMQKADNVLDSGFAPFAQVRSDLPAEVVQKVKVSSAELREKLRKEMRASLEQVLIPPRLFAKAHGGDRIREDFSREALADKLE